MPAPKKLDPNPKTPRMALGLALRRFREASGLTQEQLAERISYSHSQVSQVERGGRSPSLHFVEECSRVLGAREELLALYAELETESAPSWFRNWVEVERVAVSIRSWEPQIVPGLLQTEDYARATILGEPNTSAKVAEKALEIRMSRQDVFQREQPLLFWSVLDECALLRPVGGRDVFRRQLEHLLEMLEFPHVGIQIAPLAQGSPTGVLGGFALALIPGARETVYLESAGASGQVTDQPDTVQLASIRYETLRADALSRGESRRCIKEMIQKWT
ncbi:helix-turn-helix transcriptional regulator [Streptosporangium sp. NPDC020145]|uniref:helix-turn-helix domain-containing protein n=1 Tax=Streptosporangium sp. NPDC020145 TaxID=3154694 RepID=UPI0034176E0D